MRLPVPLACCLMVAAIGQSGCGHRPKLVPVTGQVTYKGQPLTAGSIWFHANDGEVKGEKTSCQLALDGSFTMRTYPHGHGVRPGTYQVTLSPELAGRVGMPAYGDPARTPWKLDVPDTGVRDHLFEVK